MPTYISNKGIPKNTKDMDTVYIQNALAKAKQDGNQANIDALEEELKSRGVN